MTGSQEISLEIVAPTAEGGYVHRTLTKATSELMSVESWFLFYILEVGAKSFDQKTFDNLFVASLLMPHDLALGGPPIAYSELLPDDTYEPVTELADKMLLRRREWWKTTSVVERLICARITIAFAAEQIGTAREGIVAMMLNLSRTMRGGPDTLMQGLIADEVFSPRMRDLDTLFEPENIRRVIRGCPIWSEWVKSMFLQHIRMLVGMGAFAPDEIMAELNRANAEGRFPTGTLAEVEDMLPRHARAHMADTSGYPRYKVRRARRVLVRSVNGFRRLCGGASTKELHAFLCNGTPIVAKGRLFDWHIKKKWSPVLQAIRLNDLHCPFSLDLIDKETGHRLTSLCVYFDETPLVDMIAAIIMHIKTEEGERRLIGSGNFYAMTDAGIDDPRLRAINPDQFVRPLGWRIDETDTEFSKQVLTDAETVAKAAALPVVMEEIQRATRIPPRLFRVLSHPFDLNQEAANERINQVLFARAVL